MGDFPLPSVPIGDDRGHQHPQNNGLHRHPQGHLHPGRQGQVGSGLPRADAITSPAVGAWVTLLLTLTLRAALAEPRAAV